LDPLPSESADALLKVLLGDDASLTSLKTLLIERTEGNPFFLEEGVRTLVETQVLSGDSGAYRLSQELPTIQVPPTVQAVLAARMDRLSEKAKRLLQTASVIGNEVPFPLLQAIAELPDEVLYPCLTHLQAAGFLYETSLFPECMYTFKHALTHDVAYHSLLRERRRVLHACIVEALESLAADRFSMQVERLADHAVRGEVWDKAVDYLCQAGDKALARVAVEECLARYEQALRILSHLPMTPENVARAIDVRLRFQQPLIILGQLPRFLHLLEEAERFARQLNHQARLGLVVARISACELLQGHYEKSITAAQQALGIAKTMENPEIRVLATHYFALSLHSMGRYDDAVALYVNNVEGPDADLAQRLIVTQGSFYLMGCGGLTWIHSMLGNCAPWYARSELPPKGAEVQRK